MIVASTDEAHRKVVLGRLSAAISAGSILGPAIGGFSAHYFGNHWIGVVGAVISAAGGLLVLFFVPEIKPAPKEHQKLKWIDLSFFQKYPSIKPFFWIAVAASFALATLEGTFGRLIKATLGYGEREFGIIFSYEGLLGVLVSAFVLQWLGKKLCDTSLLRLGYILQGVGLVINPFVAPLISIAPGMVWLLLASTFYALGAGIVGPTLSALTSNSVPDEAQGELFGNLQAARTFGFIIGPIVGGALFDVSHAAPYIFAALVCVTVAFALPAICACHPKKA
jgi:MFS family permease